jgi:sugar phosphate isomerase/epimerase
MKFAMPIWYGDRPLRPVFERAHRLGFDYIEFSLDYPWPDQLTEEEIKLLKGLKEEYGLEIAFHGPWAGKVLSHPRDEISNASLKVHEKCLKFAGKFNPLYFNFHQSGQAATFTFEEVRKRIFEKALETTREIVKLGRENGFPITIENNPWPFFGSPKHIEFVLEEISDLNFCFDIGHAVVSKWEIQRGKSWEVQRSKSEKQASEKLELEDWFDLLKDRILTIHLHDCLIKGDSKPKDHLVIGRGSLNFEKIAWMIKRTSCMHMLLETYYLEDGSYPPERDLKNNLEFCRSLIK